MCVWSSEERFGWEVGICVCLCDWEHLEKECEERRGGKKRRQRKAREGRDGCRESRNLYGKITRLQRRHGRNKQRQGGKPGMSSVRED